jgi:trehalose 6-phosphate synthase/phosphatase
MANKTIWPLFHSLTRFTTFSHRFWDVYVKINQRFADEMVSQLELEPESEPKPIDSYAAAAASSAFQARSESKTILFIQDYHLLLVPAMLRKKIKREARAAIAFFLHIPFPSFDILRALPWAEELLVGLLGSDLVGFHTQTYATNFLDAVRHILGARARVGPDQVIFDGRCIRVGAFSLGIPFDKFVSMATSPDPKVALLRPLVDSSQASELPQQYLLGVDRVRFDSMLSFNLKSNHKLFSSS